MRFVRFSLFNNADEARVQLSSTPFLIIRQTTDLFVLATFLNAVFASMLITSLAGAVAKYCDKHVCLSVCLSVSVCLYISETTRAIFTNFSVHVAYGRSSILLRQGDEIPRGTGTFVGFSSPLFVGFSSPLTMHCNAFAANGIGREGGDGTAQRGRSVIYDWLVLKLPRSLTRYADTSTSDPLEDCGPTYLMQCIFLPNRNSRSVPPSG